MRYNISSYFKYEKLVINKEQKKWELNDWRIYIIFNLRFLWISLRDCINCYLKTRVAGLITTIGSVAIGTIFALVLIVNVAFQINYGCKNAVSSFKSFSNKTQSNDTSKEMNNDNFHRLYWRLSILNFSVIIIASTTT